MSKGPLITVFSTIFFALMGLTIKILSPQVSSEAVVFYRVFVSLIIMLALLIIRKQKIKIINWPALITRAVFGTLALFFFFKSIALLSLGEATMLCYTYPLFASLLAAIYSEERISPGEWAAVAVSLAGIVLIVNPTLSFHIKTGYIYGILSGIFAGIAIFSMKIARKTEDSITIVLVFMLIASVLTFPFYVKSGIKSALPFLPILFAIGLFGAIAQILITYAYKFCRVVVCSTLSLLVVVFSILLDILVRGEYYSAVSLVGIFLVLSANVYISLNPIKQRAKTIIPL